MTSPEQSLVVGKMHPRDRREDADRLALLAGTTREEVESRRRGRLVHSAERKTRDFTVGSRGGVRIPIRRVKGGYKWGSKGKVYRNRKDAERQAAAAYASGYKKSMSWFNVLKLSGYQLEDADREGDERYRETTKPKKGFFYNQDEKTTTRPHYEAQAVLSDRGGKSKGNLQAIRNAIEADGNVGDEFKPTFAFTAPDENTLISWKKTPRESTYPKSKALLKPSDLDHEASFVITFDSIYNPEKEPLDKIDDYFGSKGFVFNNFRDIWNNDGKSKLRKLKPKLDIFGNPIRIQTPKRRRRR